MKVCLVLLLLLNLSLALKETTPTTVSQQDKSQFSLSHQFLIAIDFPPPVRIARKLVAVKSRF